ncbi:MAG: PEGA domain-containing protein [Candidatus Krumholzibacteriota bacterium]
MRSTEFSLSRMIRPALALAGILFLVSCGAEAPTVEPGNIRVTSEPEGAAIFLDGEDTGFITPHTLTGLDPAIYLVWVEMADFVSDKDTVSVFLGPLDTRTVDFTLSQTGFRINSPTGARILVDQEDTGKTVPASVAGLEPGTVMVSLELEGFVVTPSQYEVTIVDKQITDIPDDVFTLSVAAVKKTVFLEGFANVSCVPCPELTENLVAMAAKPEFSSDRVLYLEFSVSWPELGDPFFLANPQENSARSDMYQVSGAPELYVDGVKQAEALDASAMENAVLAALDSDPGFLVDVTADFTNANVPVTVTLDAIRNTDLTGHVLFVAIYEEVIVIDPAPGLNGQTEFHHVFRDRLDTLPILGALTAGEPQQFNLTLQRGGAAPDNYVAIAFVQHDVSHAILQAGSTIAPAPSPERIFR